MFKSQGNTRKSYPTCLSVHMEESSSPIRGPTPSSGGIFNSKPYPPNSEIARMMWSL
ncbi:rCG22856 [Rattus norvegicus]|uniref:RCG22856 n=1 Tax=Rattus norvegicus TaxID=10116 RepID=A6KP58_RAT|nr:rCG22856 [Rattus norvegicus]